MQNEEQSVQGRIATWIRRREIREKGSKDGKKKIICEKSKVDDNGRKMY